MRICRFSEYMILLSLFVAGCSYFAAPTIVDCQQVSASQTTWSPEDGFDTNVLLVANTQGATVSQARWYPWDIFDTNTLLRLVESIPNVNARNSRGETLLHSAVVAEETVQIYAGHTTWSKVITYSEQEKCVAVRFLLQHGADPNLRADFSESTPLELAILKGLQCLSRVFLEAEFSSQLEESTLMAARATAERTGMTEIVRRIDVLLLAYATETEK